MSVNVSHYTTNPECQEPEESMSVNAFLITRPILRVRTRRINECKCFSLPSQSLGSEPEEINECKRFLITPDQFLGSEPEESMSVNVSHYTTNP